MEVLLQKKIRNLGALGNTEDYLLLNRSMIMKMQHTQTDMKMVQKGIT